MPDAVRPSKETFHQILQTSLNAWISYLTTDPQTAAPHRLPHQAIDLASLAYQTPPFLGGDDRLPDEKGSFSFACEEKHSTQERGNLVVNGRSTWRTRTSSGACACDLPPRVLSKQLVSGVGHRQMVGIKLADDAPFSNWPGVEGVEGYDGGNYLVVLYLAWAYILSARWVEVLGCSVGHECWMRYALHEGDGGFRPAQAHEQSTPVVEVDIGDDASEEEVIWWNAVLCSTTTSGWNATTTYNGCDYLSPWSVSAKDTGLTLSMNTKTKEIKSISPPNSSTALKYLSRFCAYHRLYAQCSVALAGALYIPLLTGTTVSLPFPKPNPHSSIIIKDDTETSDSISIADLILNQHGKFLPQYMTLSANAWGLRSILHSTFFNIDIECNLVSAWLNPAFAVIDSVSSREDLLAILLTKRYPRLGSLWLGAILTDLARSILRDVKTGMSVVDITASAWVGIVQTFLTGKVGAITTNNSNNNNEEQISIPRDDECRLLFLTASEGHDRPPVWSWKPFGVTPLCDTEVSVRQHARCADHGVEYESWEWMLATDSNNNSSSITSSRSNTLLHQPGHRDKPSQSQKSQASSSSPQTNPLQPALETYQQNNDLLSHSLSELATRGIFSWLRSTGYPLREREIYQHSWIDLDLESTDDEDEPDDDADSDVQIRRCREEKVVSVEDWLEEIE